MQTPTIDPDSPLLVGKGILTLSLLGAATGGTLGALRAQNPALLALRMGLNGSVAGLAFFGIREYLVSPILVSTLDDSWPSYAHRRASKGFNPKQQSEKGTDGQDIALNAGASIRLSPEETVAAIRNDRVLDSCIAGGMAGSVISGAFRGPRTVLPAFITSALITSTLQYGINSIRAARVQTLLTRQQHTAVPPAIPSSSLSSPSSPTPSLQATTTTSPTRPTIMERIKESLSNLSPVRKLSNEEYSQILERQRAAVIADLEAYERWVERAKGGSSRESGSPTTAMVGDDKVVLIERPKINVEQAVRELDGLERKIRALQDRREAFGDEESTGGVAA